MGWNWEESFVPDWDVPRGEPDIRVDLQGTHWHIHPGDWLLQQGKGRLPYETRHCLGMRELERDRRTDWSR